MNVVRCFHVFTRIRLEIGLVRVVLEASADTVVAGGRSVAEY